MNLPVDLIMEILYFLPVKSLFRFECVSKTWQSLIKNEICIRKQSQKEGSSSSLLLRKCDKIYHAFVLIVRVVMMMFMLLVRVMVLFAFPSIVADTWTSYCGTRLCMGESRILPPSSIGLDSFNPNFGFGFDSDSSDHKVVKFSQSKKNESVFFVEIYSMASNSWISCHYGGYLGMLHDHGFGAKQIIDTSGWVAIVFKETCCWLTKGLVGGDIILSFDMATEDFSKTLLPLDAFESSARSPSQILHFHNSLALIVGRNSLEESSFDIWRIDDLNAEGSWTKMMSIGPILGNYGSVAFWRNYEFIILEDYKNMELISCDLGSKKTKKMGINKKRFRFDTVLNYIETSVSVELPNPYPNREFAFRTLANQIRRCHSARRHGILDGSFGTIDESQNRDRNKRKFIEEN